MIQLTRLNHRPLVVNSDLIKFIEAAPDTVITLVSDEKIVVLESATEIISRVIEFRRQLRGRPPGPVFSPAAAVGPGKAGGPSEELASEETEVPE